MIRLGLGSDGYVHGNISPHFVEQPCIWNENTQLIAQKSKESGWMADFFLSGLLYPT